jgi:hypothetical protein
VIHGSGLQFGALPRRSEILVLWSREDMRTARPDDSHDFPQRQVRPEDMFQHVLSDEQVERVVAESQALQVFTADSVLLAAERDTLEKVRV